MNKKALKRLCSRALACDTMEEATDTVDRFARRLPWKNKRGTWGYHFSRFVHAFRHDAVPYSIFARGNGKLPFFAFSAIPEFTCPGAGACLAYCYSFRAWRYPAAFLRQLQNTLLLRFRENTVRNAFLLLPEDIEFRLYVDGDFESVERVGFWMQALSCRPDIKAYGYSKSWAQLLEFDRNGGQWPTNYALNLSSGSKWEGNSAYAAAMRDLPITRGEFVALPISGQGIPKGVKRYSDREYHNRVREALSKAYPDSKRMSCPGLCGSCTLSGHACGGIGGRTNDVVIGIGIH